VKYLAAAVAAAATAGIALAIIAVINGIGTNLNTQFTSINSSLK